ncbi:uncharacterized protein LOC130790424 isoform X2 [Actinidia eriantha]|uniref:uncharacterized protein LOC130790424 isoform X2 n=1 Tax=Actinidia eriantha TaxID=165200 RepID=UPI00258F08EB|nr:uncharacterized protein LOC130790424 isoform X2 [Actinidia eriantha]
MPPTSNSFFLASFNSCLFSTIMAALEQYSSSDNASVDSREYSSQDSKLEFSEDEETLITRMYNLVVSYCWENSRKKCRGN